MDRTGEPTEGAEPKVTEPHPSVSADEEPWEVDGKDVAAEEPPPANGATGAVGECSRAREADVEAAEKDSTSSDEPSDREESGDEAHEAGQGSRVFGFVRARLPGVQLPNPGRALRHIAQENSKCVAGARGGGVAGAAARQGGHNLVAMCTGAVVGSWRASARTRWSPTRNYGERRSCATLIATGALLRRVGILPSRGHAKTPAVPDATRSWVSRGRLECTSTLRRLCMAGIPPSVRGRAWTALVENRLEVTPELYSIFLTHALNLRAGRRAGFERRTDAARAAAGGEDAPAASAGAATAGDASPGEDAAAVEVGMRGTLGKEGSMRLIAADLPRTFPDLAFFHDGPMAKALREVLDAFVCFRPDVGYVQGMTFLAATLLLYMEDASAFQCLANLLTSRPFMDFYRLDAAKVGGAAAVAPPLAGLSRSVAHPATQMAPHFVTFMELFRHVMPELAAHFEEEGVAPSLFFVEWTLTLFAKNVPLDAASRLWDGFLLDREWFLYRASLGASGLRAGACGGPPSHAPAPPPGSRRPAGILRMYQKQLMAMDMGAIMRFLKRLPDVRGLRPAACPDLICVHP